MRLAHLVAERRAVAVLPVLARLQHTVGQLLGLAGVEAARGGRHGRSAVDPLAVLAVEQLAAHHDGGVGVEDRHGQFEHREVLLVERHETLVLDAHALARGRHPQQVAPQDPLSHVEHALVFAHVRHVERQRLVVDVDAHDLGIRGIDDRLTDLGETVGLLGVADGERLVEPVDERALLLREAALDRVAAQAEVAVADGEEGLGDPHVVDREFGFDESPLVDGEAIAIDHRAVPSGGGFGQRGTGGAPFARVVQDIGAGGTEGRSRRATAQSTNAARSSTTTLAPAAVRSAAPTPRSTPTTTP